MGDIFKLLSRIFKRQRDPMRYSVKQRTETITEDTRLNDTQYGSWLAVNIGTADAMIYGIPLHPGEGLSSKDICMLKTGDLWTEPIDIKCTYPAAIRLLRTISTPIKAKEED